MGAFLEPSEEVHLNASLGFTASSEQTTISNLDITADNNPLITEFTHNLTYLRARHKNGPGIVLNNLSGVVIDTIDASYINPPSDNSAMPGVPDGAQGGMFSSIIIYNCHNVRLRNLLVGGGSTGIWVVDSTFVDIEDAHGTNFYGPLPRGQFVQFINSTGSLYRFSTQQNPNNSYTEDVINAFGAASVLEVGQGFIDGNNAPNGAGIMADEGSLVRAQDVDFVRMTNGGAIAHGTGARLTATRLRSRDNAYSSPRGTGTANGIVYGAGDGAVATFENCEYYNPANPDFIAYAYGGGLVNGLPESSAGSAMNALFKSVDFVPRGYARTVKMPKWLAP